MMNGDGAQQGGARTVLKHPTEEAGVSNTVGASLDHLIGTWTAAEADELDLALAELERIDEPAWE